MALHLPIDPFNDWGGGGRGCNKFVPSKTFCLYLINGCNAIGSTGLTIAPQEYQPFQANDVGFVHARQPVNKNGQSFVGEKRREFHPFLAPFLELYNTL